MSVLFSATPPSRLTDDELKKALDECIAKRKPLDAAPLFDEALRRARATANLDDQRRLIVQRIVVDAERHDEEDYMPTAFDEQIATAEAPLRQMLTLSGARLLDSWRFPRKKLSYLRAVLADEGGVLTSMKPAEVGYGRVAQTYASAYTCMAATAAQLLIEADYETPRWREQSDVEKTVGKLQKNDVEALWKEVVGTSGKELDHVLLDAYSIAKSLKAYQYTQADSIMDHMRSIAHSAEALRMTDYAQLYIDLHNAYKEKSIKKSDQMAADVAQRWRTLKKPTLAGLLTPETDEQFARLDAPELSFEVERVVGQKMPIGFNIRYRNVAEAELRFYDVPHTPHKGTFVLGKELKKLKPLRTTAIPLPKKHRMIDATTAYYEAEGLERGTYIAAIYVADSLMCNNVVKVSDLRAMILDTNADDYVAALHALTGDPLTSAFVNGKKVDAQGMARAGKGNLRITCGADVIETNRYSDYTAERPRTLTDAWLLTDRNIYRPGQMVHFEAVVYEATTDERKVLRDRDIFVRLEAYNGNQICEMKLKTNRYGSAQGSIAIPDDVPLGQARLSVGLQGQRSTLRTMRIAIEEYKRRDNQITISPIEGVVVPGDTVVVRARATNAAGIALSGAEMAFAVCDFLGVIHEDTLTTDDDGMVEARFESSAKDNEYEVAFALLDLKGEQTHAVTLVNVKAKGYDIEPEKVGNLQSGDSANVKFSCKTPNGTDAQTTLHATLMRICDDELLAPQPFQGWDEEVDTIIGRKAKAKVRTEVVSETDIDVDGQTLCPFDFSSLQPARYRLSLSGRYANAKVYDYAEDFSVFPAEDGTKADGLSRLVVVAPDEVREGEEMPVRIGTGLDNQVLTVVVSCGQRTELKQVRLSSEMQTLTFGIPRDSKCENVSLMVYLVRDNRLAKNEKQIRIQRIEPRAEIELLTRRDMSQPGAKERWTLRTDADEMVASMYDARLDKFVSNKWNLYLAKPTMRSHIDNRYLTQGNENSTYINRWNGWWPRVGGFVPNIDGFGDRLFAYQQTDEPIENMKCAVFESNAMGVRANRKMMAFAQPAVAMENDMLEVGHAMADEAKVSVPSEQPANAPRIDFRETVFFAPQLRPDSTGRVSVCFDLPDNITSYVFRAVAHKADMAYAECNATLSVSKALTIEGGWPRFLRQGDRVEVAAVVTAVADSLAEAECNLVVADGESGRPIAQYEQRTVTFGSGKQQRLTWTVEVPENITSLHVEMSAKAHGHTDVEVRDLMVEPNRIEVAESETFVLLDPSEYVLRNPYAADANTRSLTFRYTANTFMEVLRALPSLGAGWSEGADTYVGRIESSAIALLLAQNPDLKEAVSHLKDMHAPIADAANTPWRQLALELRKHDAEVADMVLTNKATRTLTEAVKKLGKLQAPNGGFSWFGGMQESSYLTTYVVGKMGELMRLGALNDAALRSMVLKGNAYIKRDLTNAYDEHRKDKNADLGLWYADELLAFALTRTPGDTNEAIEAMVANAAARWAKADTYTRITIARLLQAMGRRAEAQDIAESLRQNVVRTEGYAHVSERSVGGWFRQLKGNAELVMLFGSLGMAPDEVKLISNWLVVQKRGDYWPDREATSRAVLALLGTGEPFAHTDVVTLGSEVVELTPSRPQVLMPVGDVNTQQASVRKAGDMPSWGAWTRINASPIADLKASSCAELSVERVIRVRRGREFVDVCPGDELHVGDVVRVSLTLKPSANLSFVELTDYRPASFEPVDFASGYRGFCWWGGGVPHYFSPSDTRVSFYVYDLMRNHSYTFEYEAAVTLEGSMTGGYAEARCLFAPEVVAHSEGTSLR